MAGAPGQSRHVDGPGARARFVSPRYMVSDGVTMLYISDTNGAAIRTYNTESGVVDTFAGTGVQVPKCRGVTRVAVVNIGRIAGEQNVVGLGAI